MKYSKSLDGLRALFILAVMGIHAGTLSGGFLGVDSFFTLSGYLITFLLLEEWTKHSKISLRLFYLRRALRLFPALFALVLFWTLFGLLFRSAYDLRIGKEQIFPALFYYANYARAFGSDIGILGHTWSLSVEEQFYIAWPPLLLLLLKTGWSRKRIVILLFIFIVLVNFWRLILFFNGSELGRIYYAFDTRADALLIGCAFALFPKMPEFRWASWGLEVIFILWIITSHTLGAFTMLALTILPVLTVVVISQSSHLSFLRSPLLVWLGKLSYSLYLWHYPVFSYLKNLPVHWRFLAALIAACVSYYFIEIPFLRLKLRFSSDKVIKVHGS